MESTSKAETIELLIESIQNYEFIYNLNDKHHRDTLKVDHAWQCIANVTGMAVEDCKRQWKNLRDRFTKEKRLLLSGSGASQSNWYLFEKMMFYNKFSKPRNQEEQDTKLETDEGVVEQSANKTTAHSINKIETENSQKNALKIEENLAEDKENSIDSSSKFDNPKEKQCWDMYCKMSEKGVAISFDTILRGMLTPTEYRLRRKPSIPTEDNCEITENVDSSK